MKRLTLLLVLICLPAWGATPTLSQAQQVGPIRLGLAQSKLAPRLGTPASESKPVLEAATGTTVKDQSYPKFGLSLTLGRDSDSTPWLVNRFTVTKPCPWKTPQGIGIGSTASQIRKAYSTLLDKESTTDDQLVVGTVYGGIIFKLKKGRVYSIFVGAAAE